MFEWQARPSEAYSITAYLQGDPPKPGDDLTSEMVGETSPDVLQIEMRPGLAWSHTCTYCTHASGLLASCKHSIFSSPTGPLRRANVVAIHRPPAIVTTILRRPSSAGVQIA